MSPLVLTAKQHHFRVRDEGRKVVLIIDGRAVEMPPEIARQLARALHAKAGRAEEVIEHERLAYDQAILTRAGAPFGLTNRPEIVEAAIREAGHNRDLRRYMPGGIKSRGYVGAPTIVVHPPKPLKEPAP